MPPLRPLVTPCRYGHGCTRPDCYFTHPEGVRKDLRDVSGEECPFGRDCFRKVCHRMHSEGRMLEQMRPNTDFCSVYTLVQPDKLSWVSAAFQAAYPAPNDGKYRCDFVAAVPMALAYADWKNFRGLSPSGIPDGVPSRPECIRLFPRTPKGEHLLQDPANRLEMRWSPTPCRPWKTLERMANHDQHWEGNQPNYVLCAGYEDKSRGKGVCIELAATGAVTAVDGGHGVAAGVRVASDVLGLPGAQDQRWSVYFVSAPDGSDYEGQVATIRTVLDTSMLPVPQRHFQQTPRPSAVRAPSVGLERSSAAFAAPPVPPPAALAQIRPQSNLEGAAPLQRKQQALVPGGAVAYASSTAPVSMDSDIGGSTFSFGSHTEEVPAVGGAQGPPRSAPGAGDIAGGATFVFGSARPTQQTVVPPVAASSAEERAVPLPATISAAPVVAVDELGNLLKKLNMTKYRPKFTSKQVDYKMLKMMSEEDELSDVGLPLGPRIKLMQELGIERANM